MLDQYKDTPFIVLPGIEAPIKVVPLGSSSRFDVRSFTQNPSNNVTEIDNPHNLKRIQAGLIAAGGDSFESLVQSQPLVQAGKVSHTKMSKVLNLFRDRASQPLVGELIDLHPQTHFPSLHLPENYNALVYRGPWTVNIYKACRVDVSNMDPEKDVLPVIIKSGIGGKLKTVHSLQKAFNTRSFGGIISNFNLTNRHPGDHRYMTWEHSRGKMETNPSLRLNNGVSLILGSTLSIEDMVDLYEIPEEDYEAICDTYIKEKGFVGTNFLRRRLTKSKNWETEVKTWERASLQTEQGRFDIEDPLQVELEFRKFGGDIYSRNERFQGLVEDTRLRPSLPPIPEVNVMDLKDRHEAGYVSFEALSVLNYLAQVKERARELRFRLVVAANLRTGSYAVEPIREFLEPISTIFETDIGSGRRVFNIPDELKDLLNSDKFVFALVDATPYPSSLGDRPRSLVRFARYLEQGKRNKENALKIRQWNPELRAADYLQDGGPQEALDPKLIDGPTAILINYSMPNEAIPEWLQHRLKKSHKPAHFDDWAKNGHDSYYFNDSGLQVVTAADSVIGAITSMTHYYIRDRDFQDELPYIKDLLHQPRGLTRG